MAALLLRICMVLMFTSQVALATGCPWELRVARLLTRVMDPVALAIAKWNIRYIRPTSVPSTQRGRQIFLQVQEEFSPPLEPFMVQAPSEDLLLGFWIASYESFASPYLSRVEKEDVAISVSAKNRCEYCHVAHIQMQLAAHGCVPGLGASYTGSVQSRTEAQAVRKVFEYINRMMLVFTKRGNSLMLGTRTFAGYLMGAAIHSRVGYSVRRFHVEGLSLSLLGQADPAPVWDPSLVGWAESRPHIQHAFAVWHALMLQVESRLPVSDAGKAYLRNLVLPGEVPPQPAEEAPIREFAEQLILNPAALKLPRVESPLRQWFRSDVAWLEFVGWCSYLATLAGDGDA